MSDSELYEMAVLVIKNYLNNPKFDDMYIESNFRLAINRLITNAKELDLRDKGVSSMTEGSLSVTFDNAVQAFSITDDIKALLPKPYIRMW